MAACPDPPTADEVSLLPAFRAVIETASLLGRVSGRHVESLGLTGAQFDVIATLGDTPGMTCKVLGERTLITKGTLSPVLDRLAAKGLIGRSKGETDARQVFVSLTAEGQRVYERTFMAHVDFMRGYLDSMPANHQTRLIELLAELRGAFSRA